jgi:hypothetical protein
MAKTLPAIPSLSSSLTKALDLRPVRRFQFSADRLRAVRWLEEYKGIFS